VYTEELPEAQQIYDELILALLDEFRKIRETLMHASRHGNRPRTGSTQNTRSSPQKKY